MVNSNHCIPKSVHNLVPVNNLTKDEFNIAVAHVIRVYQGIFEGQGRGIIKSYGRYVTDSLMGDVRNTKLHFENIKL